MKKKDNASEMDQRTVRIPRIVCEKRRIKENRNYKETAAGSQKEATESFGTQKKAQRI